MGQPDRIIGPDGKLDRAHHFKLPPLGTNMIVYFYPKEGMPYFNLFVFMDREEGKVVHLVVDVMRR
jgi:hypothetical protein